MILLDRKKRADKYLEWKVRLFSVAAVFALAGIYTENRWLTGVAITLLLGGVILRFLPRGDEGQDSEDPD